MPIFLQNESIRIDSHNESNRIDSNRELECSSSELIRYGAEHCRCRSMQRLAFLGQGEWRLEYEAGNGRRNGRAKHRTGINIIHQVSI